MLVRAAIAAAVVMNRGILATRCLVAESCGLLEPLNLGAVVQQDV